MATAHIFTIANSEFAECQIHPCSLSLWQMARQIPATNAHQNESPFTFIDNIDSIWLVMTYDQKSKDFILPVSNTLALPFPILFLKGQIDEDKDRVENPKNFDWPWCNWWNWWCFWSVLKSDHAMQLVKLVCFKVWPCYASEVGDVFWLLWHQGDRVPQSSGHCFCLEMLTLSETIINNDH